MNAKELSDQDLLEIVQPLAEHTEKAWNQKSYQEFIRYLAGKDVSKHFPEQEFNRQIEESFEKYGLHTIGDLIAIHRNPDNVIVMWKVTLEKRDEPGLLIYYFQENDDQVLIQGCTYHA